MDFQLGFHAKKKEFDEIAEYFPIRSATACASYYHKNLKNKKVITENVV
jgi:hypothetical protein